MVKVALQKYRLTQAQLRSLNYGQAPELDAAGRVDLMLNETGKPYRFGDTTPRRSAGLCVAFHGQEMIARGSGEIEEIRQHDRDVDGG